MGLVKKQKLMKENWDYLIVLDACRYDVFEDIYEGYLDGKLEKRRSKGSSTLEWAAKNFKDFFDVNYISANPYINSKGISLDNSRWGSSCDYEWDPSNHFSNIIDVWEFGWDEDLGTVPPKNVNKAFLSNKTEKRTIIHYMQPHAPYISGGEGRKLEHIRKGFEQNEENETDAGGVFSSIAEKIRPGLEEFFRDKEFIMKIGMWLDLRPEVLVREVLGSGTRDTLMNYYEDNLRKVLETLVDLIQELDGNIVVTSDHGEAFGEFGIWEHHVETHIPVLMEVPWLQVKKP